MTEASTSADEFYIELEPIWKDSRILQKEDSSKNKELSSEIDRLEKITKSEIKRRDSRSRSRIALILTGAYILTMNIIIICAPLYNLAIGQGTPLEVKDLIEAFNSAFGTFLGFALGYYFKNEQG